MARVLAPHLTSRSSRDRFAARLARYRVPPRRAATRPGLTQVLGSSMKYDDGSKMHLGDIVRVPTPDGNKEARVVMLGDSRDHLELDPDFIEWIVRDNILASTSIFVEWLGANPIRS